MTDIGKSQSLSVSDAMACAKGVLEGVSVRLVGEISEFSHKSGYKAVYFTVKDKKASLPCMMWVNRFNASGVTPAVGQLVELTGRFTLYAVKGTMNFDVSSMVLAGEGDLRLRVANLAKSLEAEGLMSPERKKPLPQVPLTIGLVTSPRGDVVHDVLRTLRRRFPLARVVVAGVPVEGVRAAEGLIEGMRSVLRAKAEVILLVRGGGSFENMMPFNDEALARAISMCPVPVVTGIGHEPDTTIADMVADVRASTPTGAAQAASPSPEHFALTFEAQKSALNSSIFRMLERSMSRVTHSSLRPIFKDPQLLFAGDAQSIDYLAERLTRALPANLSRDFSKFEILDQRLYAAGDKVISRFEQQVGLAAARLYDLSPLAVLGRGYSLTRSPKGAVVKSVHSVNRGDLIDVVVSDGTLVCQIEEVRLENTETIVWEDDVCRT